MSRAPLPTPPTDAEVADLRPPGSGILAKVIVGVIVAVVVIVITLVYRRSNAIREPTAAVVVEGDRSLDGAKVVVEEQGPAHRSWTVVLGNENNWKTPVWLEPGIYRVSVTHDDHRILFTDVSLEHLQGWNIPVPSAVRIAGSAAIGDALVEITSTSPAPNTSPPIERMRLSKKNEFQFTAYLLPGSYHIIATHADSTVYEGNFNVDRANISRVDLTKTTKADGDQ